MKKFYATVFIALMAVSANAACSETINIGSARELDAFRDRVNDYVDGTEKKLCAVLTADIAYTGGGSTQNNWIPIKMYEGTFDGQGHTISGLYYTAPLSSETDGENTVKNSYFDAGFFANLAGSAVVKNLHITDATFAADERAGGIVADVKTDASVILENVSFSGIITSVTTTSGNSLNGHFGGLIGTVSSGAVSVSLKNCYSDGTVTTAGSVESYTSGGLIGSVFGDKTKVSVSNCYSVGTVEHVASGGHSGMIIAQNSASSVDVSNVYCSASTSSSDSYVNCESTTTTVDAETYFASNLASQKSDSIASYNSHAVGVVFSMENDKLVATITDATNNFALDKDVFVDEVRFNRTFTNNKSATFALPFTISASAVTGGTFYKLSEIKPKSDESERDTIVGSGVTTLEAYKPYLVKPDAVGGSIAVTGGATLKATTNATLVDEFADNWAFVTVLDRILWTKTDNADEMRRVYYFAGQEAGGEVPGNFVNLYNTYSKANQKPLRAYLRYTGEMPAGCAAALCKAAAVEELPEEFVVQFVEAPVVKEEIVEEISSTDNPSEETLGIAQPFRTPADLQETRWFDLKGRKMNNKPTSQGSFIKNGTPVIVK